MSRFYFDLHNGDGATRDDEGVDLASRDLVSSEVSRILTDVARDELPDRFPGVISVNVRDENGKAIYVGSLSFKSKWLA